MGLIRRELKNEGKGKRRDTEFSTLEPGRKSNSLTRAPTNIGTRESGPPIRVKTVQFETPAENPPDSKWDLLRRRLCPKASATLPSESMPSVPIEDSAPKPILCRRCENVTIVPWDGRVCCDKCIGFCLTWSPPGVCFPPTYNVPPPPTPPPPGPDDEPPPSPPKPEDFRKPNGGVFHPREVTREMLIKRAYAKF